MKKICLSNLLKFSVLIVFVGLSNAETLKGNTLGEFSPVDSNRVTEILTMISERTKSNYEQIRCWQGKLEVVTEYLYEGDRAKEMFSKKIKASGEAPKKLCEIRETNIDFSLDAEKELLYVKYYNDSVKPLRYIDLENGKDLEAKGILATRAVVLTPGYKIECKTATMRDGVVTSRIAVRNARPKNASGCEEHAVYDPRRFLSNGEQIWEFFPELLESIKKNGQYSFGEFNLQIEERKIGDTTDYHVIMPSRVQGDENILLIEMIFSENNGFNIISYEMVYHKVEDVNIVIKRERLEYKKFDEVYVTCQKLEQTFDIPSGKLKKERTITFKNQKVNEPIPTKTFTYKNLGLKNGDAFIDKIMEMEYIYQDEELIPVTKEE